MKRLPLLLISILLFGCEVYNSPQEPPKLTGGKWIFVDYDIVVINSIGDVKVLKNDTICINSFSNQSFVSGGVLMKQNYIRTALDRRFIKNKTIWEFDSNGRHVYCDFLTVPDGMKPSHEPYWVSYLGNDKLQVINQDTGGSTTYTYDANQNYSTKLKLISPEISTDLYLSNGTRDKSLTVRVVLTFMR